MGVSIDADGVPAVVVLSASTSAGFDGASSNGFAGGSSNFTAVVVVGGDGAGGVD